MRKRFLKMFSNCFIVEGIKQSTIYDLQREKYFDIPKDFADFIDSFNRFSLVSLYDKYGEYNKEIIDGYIDFLLKNELAFFIDSLENQKMFPKLNLEYIHPSIISNSEVEIYSNNKLKLNRIISILEYLGCEQVQFIILSKDYKIVLTEIVASLKESKIYSIIINILRCQYNYLSYASNFD